MKKLLIMIIGVMCITSCSITRHKATAIPDTTLDIQMSDLRYLGETEISVEYSQYLGFITSIDKINGREYDRKHTIHFPLREGLLGGNTLLRNLDRASYRLLTRFPEADYYIVTQQSMTRDVLFLGSRVKAKAKVKAYSLIKK